MRKTGPIKIFALAATLLEEIFSLIVIQVKIATAIEKATKKRFRGLRAVQERILEKAESPLKESLEIADKLTKAVEYVTDRILRVIGTAIMFIPTLPFALAIAISEAGKMSENDSYLLNTTKKPNLSNEA